MSFNFYISIDSSISCSAADGSSFTGFSSTSETHDQSSLYVLIIYAFKIKVSLAEVIFTISGAGLPEEQGCGSCVEDLTDTLDELIMEIENSTNLLASINETQQQTLQQEIMEAQVNFSKLPIVFQFFVSFLLQFSVKEYEDTLLVLAVVLGVHPPLDASINIVWL